MPKNKISRERIGELFIFAEAFLWAFFPIIAISANQFLPSSFVLAGSTFLAAIFFGVIFVWQRDWHDLKKWAAWRPILLATFFIAILFYSLFFFGLQFTTAGNAALVGQMELWFTFIFFGLILRTEKYMTAALVGAGLMFVGTLLVIFQGSFEINFGDLMILLAVAVPPLGNHFQQQARKYVSSPTLMFVRNLVATPFLFAVAFAFEPLPNFENWKAALPLLLVNGFLLLGLSKIFWIEGIHRLPVAKALSLNSIIPILTIIYAYFLLDEIPTVWQLVGLVPILLGGWLIVNKNFLDEKQA